MLCAGWRGHPHSSDFPCKVTIREALKKAFKKQEYSPNPTRLGTLRDPTSHGAQGVPSALSGLVGPARPAGVISPTVWRTSWTQPHSCSHLSTSDCHPRFTVQGLQRGNSGEWMNYLGLLLLQPHSLNRKGPWDKLLPPQAPARRMSVNCHHPQGVQWPLHLPMWMLLKCSRWLSSPHPPLSVFFYQQFHKQTVNKNL